MRPCNKLMRFIYVRSFFSLDKMVRLSSEIGHANIDYVTVDVFPLTVPFVDI